MMKNFLGIVVISLLFINSSFSFEVPSIKHKKLKCYNPSMAEKLDGEKKNPNKEDYLYIIFNDDDTKAKFIKMGNFAFDESEWIVKINLKFIFMTRGNTRWDLNRTSGDLSHTSLNLYDDFYYGKCEIFTGDVTELKKYLKNLGDENLKKEQEKINF